MLTHYQSVAQVLAPNLRSRLLVTAVSLMDWIAQKNLAEYKRYRENLESFSRLIPLLKHVACKSEKLKGISVEWFTPRNVRSDCLLYYLHGGGYMVCSTRTHKRLVSKISATAGIRAIGINYRLAPENTFPAAVEDSITGYKVILDMGFDPGKIVIAGDSAGGGLAISTLVRLKELGIPLPASAVCLSPWTDLEASGRVHADTREDIIDYSKVKEIGRMYAGDKNLRHPLASPIYADLSGLPPLFIQSSSNEVLFDDAVRLHQKARAQGVNSTLEEWHGLFHVWQAFDLLLPEASMAIKRIAGFINRYI